MVRLDSFGFAVSETRAQGLGWAKQCVGGYCPGEYHLWLVAQERQRLPLRSTHCLHWLNCQDDLIREM